MYYKKNPKSVYVKLKSYVLTGFVEWVFLEQKKFRTFPRKWKVRVSPSLEENDSTKMRKSDSQRKLLSMIKNVPNTWKWFYPIKISKRWHFTPFSFFNFRELSQLDFSHFFYGFWMFPNLHSFFLFFFSIYSTNNSCQPTTVLFSQCSSNSQQLFLFSLHSSNSQQLFNSLYASPLCSAH